MAASIGLRKILWHKRFDDAQLGIFVKQAHVVFQETGDVVWGHINGVLVPNGGIVAFSGSTIFGAVRYFLATDASLMSFDFAVKAFVFVHELLLFSIGVRLSHSVGVNVHSVSSLGSGSWSRRSVSSVLVGFSLVWL